MWRWVAFGAMLTLVSCHLLRLAVTGSQSPADAAAQHQLLGQTAELASNWLQWACVGAGTLVAGETTRRVVRHRRRRKAAAAKPVS